MGILYSRCAAREIKTCWYVHFFILFFSPNFKISFQRSFLDWLRERVYFEGISRDDSYARQRLGYRAPNVFIMDLISWYFSFFFSIRLTVYFFFPPWLKFTLRILLNFEHNFPPDEKNFFLHKQWLCGSRRRNKRLEKRVRSRNKIKLRVSADPDGALSAALFLRRKIQSMTRLILRE